MKRELFPSQLATLKLAVARCKTSLKAFNREKNLLTENEMRAAEIYLRTSSYQKTARQMQTQPVMVFIYIKNTISTLHIYKSLTRKKKRK